MSCDTKSLDFYRSNFYEKFFAKAALRVGKEVAPLKTLTVQRHHCPYIMFVIFYHIDCGVGCLLVFQLLAASPLKISLVDHDPAQDDCIPGEMSVFCGKRWGDGERSVFIQFFVENKVHLIYSREIIIFVSKSEIE